MEEENILHALGAAHPVTVMEIEAFALKDECADAILKVVISEDDSIGQENSSIRDQWKSFAGPGPALLS